MADAYVNFYNQLDQREAQAFVGSASQAHRPAAAVGAAVASATAITIEAATFFVEVKPTSGSVFACLLPTSANDAAKTAARIRIDEGEKTTLTIPGNGQAGLSLFLWAA